MVSVKLLKICLFVAGLTVLLLVLVYSAMLPSGYFSTLQAPHQAKQLIDNTNIKKIKDGWSPYLFDKEEEQEDGNKGEEKKWSEIGREDLAGEGRMIPNEDEEWKTILFYTSWFGGDWTGRYLHSSPEELKKSGCPSWRCHFTKDKKLFQTADALVFLSNEFKKKPKTREPHQRYVWVNIEVPRAPPAIRAHKILNKMNSNHLVNWTMTYHSNVDILAFYGFFLSKGQHIMPVRPNLMSQHPESMKMYLVSRGRNDTLSDIMGTSWRLFVTRPKLVAWMSSHCKTLSRREQYITELEKYIKVDKYGECGDRVCKPFFPRSACWESTLGLKYLFYMSFENDICNEYITEKLYLAMLYNMVPIVWGGADYDRFLPPGSYINARHYHPKDLAVLLKKLQADPIAYGRYHVWRGFWDVQYRGSFCELCHKLHTDNVPKHYKNIPAWRIENNKCLETPEQLFSNPENPDAWRTVIKDHVRSTFRGNVSEISSDP